MGNPSSQQRTHAPHDGGGSSRSNSRSSSSTTTSAQPPGGLLDPRNQLESVYERLIVQNEQVKEQFQKAFQSVRILVVGRSGSGKSTLIRLLVGDDGPRSMSCDNIGFQDIMTEWRHPDPTLPLVIHDSNGIDVAGNERIADIKQFLDARLATGVEFAERVHAVWYVFNAIDNRVLNDGGLLELLCGYGSKELPLLLIMTHNDMAEIGYGMDGQTLGLLLAKVQGEERRKKLSEMMVKVGNKIKFNRDTGEILKQGSIRDVKGMEMVFERTKQLMGKELWITWVACQAVDMNAKLEESANLIVRFRKHQCWATSALAAFPIAHQLQLAAMFGSVTCGLSKIWNVQQAFEKAITYHFLVEERWHAVTSNLATNTLGALALASAVAATVLTGGIAAPSVLVVAMGSALNEVGSTSTLLMSYALMVMGSILYVKTHHETMADDRKATVDDYLKLCEEFLVSKWAQRVSGFSKGYTSMWETCFREKRQKKRLASEIVDFFKEISLQRPKSLFSQIGNESRYHHYVADITELNKVEEETEEEEKKKIDKNLLSPVVFY
ncbi:hypothetical protein KP509_38G013500 [Ceratopteris richardii]|uniref:G domain-containing protein n=1 Tax=Ceratopteris richardii TaxID=49495 RepID=A0A8T2Q2M2_CERRI|nr:hypothetical protein KP509_38G013500 [Ceratopteris richardii]